MAEDLEPEDVRKRVEFIISQMQDNRKDGDIIPGQQRMKKN
jgi:hypothetical protein